MAARPVIAVLTNPFSGTRAPRLARSFLGRVVLLRRSRKRLAGGVSPRCPVHEKTSPEGAKVDSSTALLSPLRGLGRIGASFRGLTPPANRSGPPSGPNSNLVRSVLIVLSAAIAALAPGQTATKPASNLDYWLGRAEADTRPAAPVAPATNPFGPSDRFGRDDALPGVAILSDGTVLAGGLYTTRDRNWEVWVESAKRWRHVPPILVLSIQAVVVEEGMDKEWRWKEMGSDEKVFTGRQRPVRRFQWRLHLIDDSVVTGTIKGQPLWIDTGGGAKRPAGPYVLHERSAGEYGQTLEELVYLKRAVVSRRAMREVLERRQGATQPSATTE